MADRPRPRDRWRLPRRIVGLGAPIRVRHGRVPGRWLAYWDHDASEIVVRPGLPRWVEAACLLHELLHVADDWVCADHRRIRRASHRWITKGAPTLVALLAGAGLLRGLSRGSLRAHLARVRRERRTATAAEGMRPTDVWDWGR